MGYTERFRFILILYEIKIDTIDFTSISLHEISISEDMFVFANELLINKGLERMFNSYFINEGQAEIKIKDVQVINTKVYHVLKNLLNE